VETFKKNSWIGWSKKKGAVACGLKEGRGKKYLVWGIIKGLSTSPRKAGSNVLLGVVSAQLGLVGRMKGLQPPKGGRGGTFFPGDSHPSDVGGVESRSAREEKKTGGFVSDIS